MKRNRSKPLRWRACKGGLEAVFKRFDGVVLDVLADGLRHMVKAGVHPKNAVYWLLAKHEAEMLKKPATALFQQIEHLTDRQIKRALLKRLRAVQQASNKQR